MHDEQQVRLVDVLMTLWRRRRLLVVGTAVGFIFGGAACLALPDVYEARAIIEPVKIPLVGRDGKFVEGRGGVSPKDIEKSIVNGVYNETVLYGLGIARSHMPSFRAVAPKNTEIVKLAAESVDSDLAQKALVELVFAIDKEIQRKHSSNIDLMQIEISEATIGYKNIQGEIKLVEGQLEDTQKRHSFLDSMQKKFAVASGADAVPFAMYADQIQKNRFHYQALQEKLLGLQAQEQRAKSAVDKIATLAKVATLVHVHQPPTITETPIKPKRPLMVTLSLLLGGMGAMLLALFQEYLKNHKQPEAS